MLSACIGYFSATRSMYVKDIQNTRPAPSGEKVIAIGQPCDPWQVYKPEDAKGLQCYGYHEADSQGHPKGIWINPEPANSFRRPENTLFREKIVWKDYLSKSKTLKFPIPQGANLYDGGEEIMLNKNNVEIIDIQTGLPADNLYLKQVLSLSPVTKGTFFVGKSEGYIYREFPTDNSELPTYYFTFEHRNHTWTIVEMPNADPEEYVHAFIINNLEIK